MESDLSGLGGGINTYTYVRNDPLMLFDPLGLCDEQKCAAAKAELVQLGQQLSSLGSTTSQIGVGIIAVDAVAEFFAPEGFEVEVPIDASAARLIEFGGNLSTFGDTVKGYARGGAAGLRALVMGGLVDKISAGAVGKGFADLGMAQRAAASSLLGQVSSATLEEEAACEH